jgi:hypothetical protein
MQILIESGVYESFETLLDKWQGMAMSGNPDQSLQALTEMARVRAACSYPLVCSGCDAPVQETTLTLPRIAVADVTGLFRIIDLGGLETQAECDVRRRAHSSARTHARTHPRVLRAL